MSDTYISQREAGHKTVLRRMMAVRSLVLQRYPFYGRLLMHLQLGCAECGTACTDQKHLLFDPEFAKALSDEEMLFVMLHEVLHCALDHCSRRSSFHQETFNAACDIVANSCILYTMCLQEYSVDGVPVMHLIPDGREGFLFSAEEVYQMLIKGASSCSGDGTETGHGGITEDESESLSVYGSTFDSHDIWDAAAEAGEHKDQWREILRKEAKGWSEADIPPVVREYVSDLEEEAKVNWRAVLQDFILLFHDRYDYLFSPADRRFSESSFVIPSFSETEDEQVENLWFCVDTSGSISPELLSDVMNEIHQALLLFEHISGRLSFFDTSVTEPVLFEETEDLAGVEAAGGGGTSFSAIFRYMKNEMSEHLPSAVIILTDGICHYPDEEAAIDVPVLWILYDNPEDAPWGKTVHIDH